MHEQDDESQLFILMLFAGVAILVSLFLSWTELKYLMFAETATADVTDSRIVEYRSRRRVTRKLQVSFQYTDADGVARSEKEEVFPSYQLPPDDTVGVEYFRGVDDSARLEGTEKYWPFVVVVGSFSFFAYTIMKFAKEANTPISRGPRLKR